MSAAAAVAVHRRVLPSTWLVPMPPCAITTEGVVLLQEQLPRGVERDRAWAPLGEELAGTTGDRRHRGLPVGLHQLSVSSDEGLGQPVWGVVGLPAVEVLRSEATVVYAVLRASTNSDDAAVLDRDVQCVAVRVQDRCRLGPRIHVGLVQPFGQVRVNAHRPLLPRPVGGPRSPGLRDPICARHVLSPPICSAIAANQGSLDSACGRDVLRGSVSGPVLLRYPPSRTACARADTFLRQRIHLASSETRGSWVSCCPRPALDHAQTWGLGAVEWVHEVHQDLAKG